VEPGAEAAATIPVYNKDMAVEVVWLGRMAYAAAWDLQKALVTERNRAERPDRLLLLEHPPVYTLGRSGKLEHLLLDEAARQAEGISVYEVDRGGDITYHGPGQLVAYPILNLKRLFRARGFARPDLHRYLRDLEEVIIRALASLDVAARRYEGYTGVWVEGAAELLKIAAIGVKVSSKGISSHGFALNVDPNLDHFAGIVPCGIHEHGVASLAQLLQRPLATVDLVAPVMAAFGEVFQVETTFVAPPVSAYNLPPTAWQ
jgi:lipoate-protein ligase B